MQDFIRGTNEPAHSTRVLVVEDDDDIVEILSLYLGGSSYTVQSAANGAAGLALLRDGEFSIALVDIMMPLMNGFDFIKKARTITSIPIVAISARSQPADKIMALDLGADGYITKPFDSMEVLAYVRAALRRCQQHTDFARSNGNEQSNAQSRNGDNDIVRAGCIELNRKTLVLRKREKIIPLTASELKIMMKFLSSPHRVFTKTQLYEAIDGTSYEGSEDSVMVHISNIRSKIEDDPSKPTLIVTVRGLGYRLEA